MSYLYFRNIHLCVDLHILFIFNTLSKTCFLLHRFLLQVVGICPNSAHRLHTNSPPKSPVSTLVSNPMTEAAPVEFFYSTPRNCSEFSSEILPMTHKKSLEFYCQPASSSRHLHTRKIPVTYEVTGTLYILSANQIKGGISRLAKSRKPQFTAVNEDLRDKRNAEITLFADFGLLVQSLGYIHRTSHSTSHHRVVAYS